MRKTEFSETAQKEKAMEDLLRALRLTESRDQKNSGLAEWSIEKFFRINDEVRALRSLEEAILGNPLV